jgi:hypothetical protein
MLSLRSALVVQILLVSACSKPTPTNSSGSCDDGTSAISCVAILKDPRECAYKPAEGRRAMNSSTRFTVDAEVETSQWRGGILDWKRVDSNRLHVGTDMFLGCTKAVGGVGEFFDYQYRILSAKYVSKDGEQADSTPEPTRTRVAEIEGSGWTTTFKSPFPECARPGNTFPKDASNQLLALGCPSLDIVKGGISVFSTDHSAADFGRLLGHLSPPDGYRGLGTSVVRLSEDLLFADADATTTGNVSGVLVYRVANSNGQLAQKLLTAIPATQNIVGVTANAGSVFVGDVSPNFGDGVVRIFDRSKLKNGQVTLLQEIRNPYPAKGDAFGWSTAGTQRALFVTAIGDDTMGPDAGMVYGYVLNAAGTQAINPEDPVSIPNPTARPWPKYLPIAADDSVLAIGSPHEEDIRPNRGVVYLFDARPGPDFGKLLKKIRTPIIADGWENFGSALGLRNGRLYVTQTVIPPENGPFVQMNPAGFFVVDARPASATFGGFLQVYRFPKTQMELNAVQTNKRPQRMMIRDRFVTLQVDDQVAKETFYPYIEQ